MLQHFLPKTYGRLTQGGDSANALQTNNNPKQRSSWPRLRLEPIKMADSDGNQTLRQQVEDNISQISQVIHAAMRPLPEQTGDGSYIPDANTQSGIWNNLSHVGIKDIATLTEVVKDGLSGAFVNDKDFLMERVIQVRRIPS